MISSRRLIYQTSFPADTGIKNNPQFCTYVTLSVCPLCVPLRGGPIDPDIDSIDTDAGIGLGSILA